MKILIIDDDQEMRTLLRQVMELGGYEVTEAANGREGINCHRQQKADLVITDLIMPEQEGLETISFLRKDSPNLKIIAISGGGRMGPDAYLPTARELGADLAFSKPFDVHELLMAVRDLLAEK